MHNLLALAMTLDTSTTTRDMNAMAFETFEDVPQSSNIFNMSLMLNIANTEYVSQVLNSSGLMNHDIEGYKAYTVKVLIPQYWMTHCQ